MRFIVYDAVQTEREPDHVVERGNLLPVRIGSVTGLRVPRLVGPAGPYQLHPFVDCDAGRSAGAGPGGVILLARPRKHDRPKARRAVAVDAGDDDARPSFRQTAAHVWSKDIELLLDRIFRFMDVDLGAASVAFVRVYPEIIFGLA